MNRRIEIEGTKKNLNRAFILPMCGINYKILPINFINSYITLDYQVVLVFDKSEGYNTEFQMFLNHVQENIRSYVSFEDNIDEVDIIFQVPEIFRKEFDLFIDGRYSKFSEYYKRIICNFFGRKTIKDDSKVTEYNIIYPEDFKRKQIADSLSIERSEVDWKSIIEVIDKPDLNREIYIPIDILKAQRTIINE